jgi:PST family polysaccharide transporter
LAQICAAIFTIICVQSADDIVNVSLASAISWGICAVLANCNAIKRYTLVISTPTLDSIKNAIFGAWHLFIGNAAVAFYANLPAFILALFGTKSEIAIFVGAQKIILAIQGLFSPIASALFPKIAQLTKQNYASVDNFIKQTIFFTILGMCILSGIVFIFSDDIARLVLGTRFDDAALFLKIMALGPILVAVSTLLYSGYIVVRNLASSMKSFFAIISVAGLIFTIVAVFFGKNYGAAISYIVIEAAVLVGLVFKVRNIIDYRR